MIFRNLVGNDDFKKEISYMFENGRLPHAIIIEGETGLGKLTAARDIARALVCKSETQEKACGECPACKKAAAGSHPDIFEFVSKLTPRSFPVDKVREIKNDAHIMPNEADCKVYILGNASSMGREAQNALLKTLEEPPKNVFIIMTAVSKTMFLETVLSRARAFKLNALSRQQVYEYLHENFSDADEQTLAKSADICCGNIGKACDSLTDGKLALYSDTALAVCKALLEGDEYAVLTVLAPLDANRDMVRGVMQFCANFFRDALVLSSGLDSDNCNDVVKSMGNRFSKKSLLSLISFVQTAEDMVNKNINNNLLITKICFGMRDALNGG